MTSTSPDADTLTWIGGLEEFLSSPAPAKDAVYLWTLVKLLEASLASDPRYTAHEGQLLNQLKQGVKHVVDSHRDGRRPAYNMARVPLAGLRKSIEARPELPA